MAHAHHGAHGGTGGWTPGSKTFEIQGVWELRAALLDAGLKVTQQASDALEEEAQIELEEAQRRVPYKTGALHDTAMRHPAQRDDRGVFVTLMFGDSRVIYAADQHETLRYLHERGQPKYLSSVLRESAPFLAERIARRMHL